MPILIGTDEAGYGPNLGPLVVAATAWHVPAEVAPSDLFARLAHVIRPLPAASSARSVSATRLSSATRPASSTRSASATRSAPSDERLAIADSKLLYQPGGGLASLERGVLGALGTRRQPEFPTTWRAVLHSLAPDSTPALLTAPWFREFDCAAPVDLTVDEQHESSRRLRAGLEQVDVQLLDVRATAIGPEQFNREVRRRGSKGSLLTDTTLALINRLLDDVAATTAGVRESDNRGFAETLALADEPCFVTCDKHGGRNRYMGPLQHAFPDDRIQVMAEGREASQYRLEQFDGAGRRRRCVTIEFRARGEQLLPAALASMTAKYLRELTMRAFNAFWLDQLPGLEPTAGYPVDAKRFLDDIREAQSRLNISDDILWREK